MKYDKNKITVIVPTKNEADGIRGVIRKLKAYCGEIIVVDGHSQDRIKKIVQHEKAIFFLDNKKGKGEAVRLGLKHAKGDIVIIFDGDGSPNEKDIPKLVLPILRNKADLVISSRRTGGSFDFSISLIGILRTMGSDFLAFLVNKRFNTNFSDILYCFRAIRRSIIEDLHLSSNKFDIEQEIIIKCLKKKYRILEIPSRENARAWGTSKLSTITGIKLMVLLLKELYV